MPLPWGCDVNNVDVVALQQYQRLVQGHPESRNRNRHLLELADQYGALSRRYVPLYAGLVLVYGVIQARYWSTLPFFHSIGCHNRVNGCQPDPFYYLGILHEFLTGGSPLPDSSLAASSSEAFVMSVRNCAR